MVVQKDQAVETYLKEIARYPLLKAEEEVDLAHKIAKGDSLARTKMIQSNLRLVVAIAKNYNNRGLSLSDLIEEGNLGLLKAVERFDPAEGCRFSTYGSWWIKQAIKRALVDKSRPVRIPAYMVELIARWKKTADHLRARFNRPPTPDEISREMKLSPEKIAIVKRVIQNTTVADPMGHGDPMSTLSSLLEDRSGQRPEDRLFSEAETSSIEKLLSAIDHRDAEILRLRFGLGDGQPMTYEEIGKTLNLTRERIRQIVSRALDRLHRNAGYRKP